METLIEANEFSQIDLKNNLKSVRTAKKILKFLKKNYN